MPTETKPIVTAWHQANKAEMLNFRAKDTDDMNAMIKLYALDGYEFYSARSSKEQDVMIIRVTMRRRVG